MRIVIAIGGTVGLAEWIIDDTNVLYRLFYHNVEYEKINEDMTIVKSFQQ